MPLQTQFPITFITQSTPAVPSDLPIAAFTYTSIGNQTIHFTDTSYSVSGPGIDEWAWDFGDSNTSTTQNPDHTYATAGNYTVTLTVTDEAGDTVFSDDITVAATGAEFAPTATGLLYHFYGGNGVDKPAGITAGGDAEPVSAWQERGTTYTAEQASGSAQPVWFKSVNLGSVTRGGVEADGGDWLEEALSGDILRSLNVYTIYFTFRTLATDRGMLASENRAQTTAFLTTEITRNQVSIGGVVHSHRAGADTTPALESYPVIVNDGDTHLLVIRRIGASSWSMRVDGVEVDTLSTLTTPAGGTSTWLMMFAHRGTSNPTLFGDFMLFDWAAYNVDNYATVENEFLTHYGITP